MLRVREKAALVTSYGLKLLLALFMVLGTATAQVARTALQGSTPPALAPGAPAGSYTLSGFDTVNLYNGNLNFALPLYKVGGRGEAQYTMMLPIEHHWHLEHHMVSGADISFKSCKNETCDPFGTAASDTSIAHIYVPRSDWWGLTGGSDSANPPGPPPHTPGLLVARSQGRPNPSCTASKTAGGQQVGVSYVQTTTVLTFTGPDGTEYEFRDKLTGGRPLSTKFGASPCNPTNTDRGSIFVTTDGTSATFISQDDNGNQLDIQDDPGIPFGVSYPSGTLYLANGVVYQISQGTIKTITDRNGNRMQFTYGIDPVSQRQIRVVQIVDPLGRSANITYGDTANPPANFDTITYPGFNGATRTLTIWHAKLVDVLRTTQPSDVATVSPKDSPSLFSEVYAINDANLKAANCCAGGNPADERFNVVDPVVIQAVELPDGRRYQFKYNQYGELARVDLPTGGAYEYDWGSGAAGSAQGVKVNSANPQEIEIYRRVQVKRTYNTNNVLEAVETFSPQESFDSQLARNVTAVTDDTTSPAGTLLARSIHYFLETTTSSLFLNGGQPPFDGAKEFKTEAYNFDGVTLLRTVVNDWQEAPAACPITNSLPDLNNLPFALAFSTKFAYNPRNMDTTTTLNDSGQTSKETYQYDCFNNVTETDELDYGASTPTRVTQNTYLTTQTVGGITVDYANAATDPAKTLYLRRLLTKKTVSGAAGAAQSLTVNNYDEDASLIADDPGIVGFAHQKFPFTYRTRGNPTSTTRYTNAAASSGPITSKSAYDIAGNVVSATDPNNNTTLFSFDATGGAFAFVSKIQFPIPGLQGSSSALVVQKSNDFNTGLLTSFTDANNNVTRYDYTDPLDRPVSVRHPDGGSTTFTYGDTVGDLNLHTITALDSARNMEGYTYFDGLGRKIRDLQFDGTEGTPWIAKDTGYDGMGRLLTMTNPYRVSQPSATPGGCTVSPCTTTGYDALSRVASVTGPDGQAVTTTYTGNSTRTTDQVGNTRDQMKDALGRLTKVTENPTNVNNDGSPVTTYNYDALDDLLCVHQKGTDSTQDPPCGDASVPAGWRPRNFTYDSLSRMLAASNPESGITQYGYDNNGNLTTQTDANGTKIITTYDHLNRPSLVTSNDQSTPSITHYYDGMGTTTAGGNSLGRVSLVHSDDPSAGDYSFDNYDAVGRVLGTTQTVDGQPYPMFYTYDLAGHLTKEKYPSGRVVQTDYNPVGRVSSVSAPQINPQPYADQIHYWPHGAMESMLLGNGLFEHTQVDPNRLQTTEIDVGTSLTTADFLSLQYDYHDINGKNNGNVQRQMIAAAGLAVTQLVQYDGLNRLLKMQEVNGVNVPFPFQPTGAVWEEDFSHDFWGNRTRLAATGVVPVVPMVPPDTNNRIDVTQNNLYGYDAAGYLKQEPVGSGTNSYSYDAEGRLIQAQEGANLQTFKYDGQGYRVKKISGNLTTVSGKVTTVYVRDTTGQLIAEYTTSTPQNNGTRYLTGDIVGSERLLTGTDSGQPTVVARYDYLPFGELVPLGLPIGRSAAAGYGNTSASRQKFTGKERDEESQLDYFGARYYSNSLGRFPTPDRPLADQHASNPQSWNLYAYVLDSPLHLVDPTGTQTKKGAPTGKALERWKQNRAHDVEMIKRNGADTVRVSGTGAPSAAEKIGIGEAQEKRVGDYNPALPHETKVGAAVGLLDTVNEQAPFWLSLFRQGNIEDFKRNAIPYNKFGVAVPIKFHPCEDSRCVEMAPQVGNGHGRIPGQERVYTDYGYYKIAPDIVEEQRIVLPPVPDAKLWDRQMSNQYWDKIKRDFPIFNPDSPH